MNSSASSNGEKVIHIVSEHWIKYVLPVCVYLLFTSLGAFLIVLAGVVVYHAVWLPHVSFISGLIILLLIHHWFFTRLLGESMSHIIITDRRVVWMHDNLFFREQMTEYAFDKMKTVASEKQGLLQTILRYGVLTFESGPDIRLVPHPNRVAKDIEQAMGLK